jgi:transglutaminase-like putative cysteine protease
LRDIEVLLGDTVLYRLGVTVTDSYGNSISRFDVDSSQVDTNVPGTHRATYSAVDVDGNRAEITVTVTVSAVSGDMIYGDIDAILARILTDGMNQRTQAQAIFTWISRNIHYVFDTPRDADVYEAAYRALSRRQGDCFTLYAISEILLTRAGIPNMRITRTGSTSRHYWNLVNPDGEGWFHFDTTPPNPSLRGVNRFLFTDSEAAEYSRIVLENEGRRNYYHYDRALYPEVTP